MKSKLTFVLGVLLLVSSVVHAEDSDEPRYKLVYEKGYKCEIVEIKPAGSKKGESSKESDTSTYVEVNMVSTMFGTYSGSVDLSDNRQLVLSYDHDYGVKLTLLWMSPKDKKTAVRRITAGAGYEHFVTLSTVSPEGTVRVECYQKRSYVKVEDSSTAAPN